MKYSLPRLKAPARTSFIQVQFRIQIPPQDQQDLQLLLSPSTILKVSQVQPSLRRPLTLLAIAEKPQNETGNNWTDIAKDMLAKLIKFVEVNPPIRLQNPQI